eukprot:768818-Hanusia_phi.AAC.13
MPLHSPSQETYVRPRLSGRARGRGTRLMGRWGVHPNRRERTPPLLRPPRGQTITSPPQGLRTVEIFLVGPHPTSTACPLLGMVRGKQVQRVVRVAGGGLLGGLKSAVESEPIAVYSIVLGVVGVGVAYVAPQIWPLERQVREQQYIRGTSSNRITDY